MIHTLSLIINSPTNSQFKPFLEATHKFNRDKNNNRNLSLKDQGITVEYKTTRDKKNNDILRRYLYCTVNLSKLLKLDQPETSLINEINFDKIESNFNSLIKEIYLPELKLWIPNRIDYSINLIVPDKNLYLKLIKKAGILTHSKKNKEYKTSIRYSNKSYALNLYDKQAEIYNKTKIKNPAASNILRFELQLFNSKLNTLKKHNEKNLLFYFDEKLIKETLLNYCTQAFYKSNHQEINKAKKIIENSNLRKNKAEAIKLLTQINKQHSSIKKVLDSITDKKEKAKTKKLLNKIDQLGINPVCLSYKDKSGSHITSLYNLIDQQFPKL